MAQYLRDILKEKSTRYYDKFCHIEKECKDILPEINIPFPEYNDHAVKHAENVEKIMEWLIPDDVKKSLNYEEIFCLLSAVWLHDIGKVLDKETKIFKKSKKDEKEKIKKNTRDLHHIRSYNFIKSNSTFKLNDREAEAIGNICKTHRKTTIISLDEKYKVNKKKVRLQFLGACLRLADKCDINSDRIISKQFKKTRFTWEFTPHTKKHKFNFVNFQNSKRKIRLEAKVTSIKDLKILIDTKEKIQKELDESKPILSQNKLILNTIELKLL